MSIALFYFGYLHHKVLQAVAGMAVCCEYRKIRIIIEESRESRESKGAMDPKAKEHLLTEAEANEFQQNGYFVVEDVLPQSLTERLRQLTADVVNEDRDRLNIPQDRFHGVLDFIGQRDEFLRLVDWYKTVPKICGLLGPEIKLYHTVGMETPPARGKTTEDHHEWANWHTDTGNLTRDLARDSFNPMISVKVGYVLSDLTSPYMANFTCIPGSQNNIDYPGSHRQFIETNARQVLAPCGSAIIFDRRLWHTPTLNISSTTRYMIFNGYSYRWLANRDEQRIRHFLRRATPIQRQLLGFSNHGAYGSSNSFPDDLPLKDWFEAVKLEGAV